MRALRALIATVALLAASTGVSAQQPAYRVETRLVVLDATVKDARGAPVTTLDRDDFTVYEDGKLQPITLFRRDDVPVSLGLVIDNSGSMRTLRAPVEAAALAFVRASNPRDEVFVMNFGDRPRLDVAMTSDLHAVEMGVARVDSIGGTALFDAVISAGQYLRDHARRDRKALLVITDGGDNASETTLKHVCDAATRDGTVVHAVGVFGSEHVEKHGRDELEQLTRETGGTALFPRSVELVGPAVVDLAREIRQQYTIGYAPTNQALDGAYRSIRVRVRGARGLQVRTRSGYRATPVISQSRDRNQAAIGDASRPLDHRVVAPRSGDTPDPRTAPVDNAEGTLKTCARWSSHLRAG